MGSRKKDFVQAVSLCVLDLTFDLTVVAMTYKLLSMLYLVNYKVQEVDTGTLDGVEVCNIML